MSGHWKRAQLVVLVLNAPENGGMGSFYRSKHELIFVFKIGSKPLINTFELGQTGGYRTNVWNYPAVNTLRLGRLQELAIHPTVKPVALVLDAIKEFARPGMPIHRGRT